MNRELFLSVAIIVILFNEFTYANPSRPQIADLKKFSDLAPISNSINQMSMDFFKIASKKEIGNFICSPFSASQVLAMAAFGAHGRTKKELKAALHMDMSDQIIQKGYSTIIKDFKKDNGSVLKMANSMFVAKNFTIIPNFMEITKNIFQSKAQNLDFGNASNAAETINRWVKVQTDNHIKELVESTDFGNQTVLSLVNAIYFNGKWAMAFDKKRTLFKRFYVSKKVVKKVPTMIQDVRVPYQEHLELDAKIIELPYEGSHWISQVSMLIIVPNKIDSLKNIESKIDTIKLDELFYVSTQKVKVFLPKFRIETKMNLKKHLAEMGIKDAFTLKANFTGINEKADLFIDQIVQKAFIDVNEQGTKASAATFAGFQSRSFEDKYIFEANRPFLVILATKNIILFIGRVNDPSK